MADKKLKIKILPKGPYELEEEIPVAQALIEPYPDGSSEKWGKGKTYENPKPGEPVHLCRCGHSKNKPFCDGTHNENGFEGEEVADHDGYKKQAQVYRGEDLVLYDDEELCAVARFCDHAEGVWQLSIDSGDADNKERAVYMACACPSGRLTVTETDGTPIEPHLEPSVGVVEDLGQDCRGPLWVKGGIPIEGADGQTYEVRNRVTLCRCGESGNMPFCDASHLQCSHMKGTDK